MSYRICVAVLAIVSASFSSAFAWGNPEEDQRTQAAPSRPGKEEIVAAGSISGGIYTNGFFRFSYKFPGYLTAQNQETIREVMEEGHREVYGEEPDADPEHREAEKRVIALLSLVGPRPPSVSTPKQVLVMAMDVSEFPAMTSQELLNGLIDDTFSGPMVLELVRRPSEQRFGGHEFSKAEFKGRFSFRGTQLPVRMAFFATVLKRYALVWQFSAGQKKELKKLVKTMKSISFRLDESAPPW